MEYPKVKCPTGEVFTVIGWAIDFGRSNWEWYAFQDEGDSIYYGYVMGFEDEFGTFSEQELREVGIVLTKDPAKLHEIQPPIGWEKVA
jgi:hypothetical protein